jgi:hypothetical protein
MPATAPTTPSAMVSVVVFVEDGVAVFEDEDEFGVPVEGGNDVMLDLAFAVVAVESLFSGLVVAAVFCAGSAVNPLCVQ